MIEIYLGKDSGNGTDLGTARIFGNTYRSFTGGYMASGEEIRSMSQENITGDAARLPKELHELNGNTDLMLVKSAKTGVDYYVGLSSSLVASGFEPINPSGLGKYNNDLYMHVMLQASVQGLMNGGMSAHLAAGSFVNLNTCFGLAPEYYFKADTLKEVEANMKQIFEDFTFTYNKVTFTVKNFIIRPEAIGAFFNYIITEDLEEDEVKSDKRYLIEDGGQTTFDTLIVDDMDMRGKPISNDQLGTRSIISQSADKVNQTGAMKVTNTDIENHLYGCQVTKVVDKELCDKAIEGRKTEYLSRVQGHTGDLYDSRSGEFDAILVTGGITKIFDSQLLESKLKIANRPVTVLGVFDNADGFAKLADIEMG